VPTVSHAKIPALVPHAIKETLRWDAPVPHSTVGYTTQDVTLGGTVIPAFAQVIISLAAANGTRRGT
jgi:cytochrome P450